MLPEEVADRQTDTHTDAQTGRCTLHRQTDKLIAVLCSPTGAE